MSYRRRRIEQMALTIAATALLAAVVVIYLSFYSLPAGAVAAVVDPVSGQISRPSWAPPWASRRSGPT